MVATTFQVLGSRVTLKVLNVNDPVTLALGVESSANLTQSWSLRLIMEVMRELRQSVSLTRSYHENRN